MDEALAKSGILVVAIDMTRAPEAPYPASVQDANYGVRWLKYKAREWNGDAVDHRRARQLERRPRSRAAGACGRAIRATTRMPLAEAPNSMRRVDYVATRSPISDPLRALLERGEDEARPK